MVFVLYTLGSAGQLLTSDTVKVLATAMAGSRTLTVVSFFGQPLRVFDACGVVEVKTEGMCMYGTGNTIKDTGVEAVVRMAATMPALKTLDLHGGCATVSLFVSLYPSLLFCLCRCVSVVLSLSFCLCL